MRASIFIVAIFTALLLAGQAIAENRVGPVIYGLQLGMPVAEADKALEEIAKEINLEDKAVKKYHEERYIGDNSLLPWAGAYYNDVDDISSFVLQPRVFDVTRFDDKEFLKGFVNFYKIPELTPEYQSVAGTTVVRNVSIDRNAGYMITIEPNLIKVRRIQSQGRPRFK